jgi:hypothetical protein
MNIFKKNLLAKLLSLIVAIAVIGGIFLISKAMKNEERGLFYEKVQASKLMSARSFIVCIKTCSMRGPIWRVILFRE